MLKDLLDDRLQFVLRYRQVAQDGHDSSDGRRVPAAGADSAHDGRRQFGAGFVGSDFLGRCKSYESSAPSSNRKRDVTHAFAEFFQLVERQKELG